MNKAVRKRLNVEWRKTKDDRKSRRGTMAQTRYSDLLKQVAKTTEN